MKTTWLLSTICSVAIMGSASAWAQSTTTTPMAAPSSGTGMAKPMHKKWMKHKPMDMNGPSDADHSADMLNAQQLKNNMSPMSPPSSAMPMAPGSTMPMAPATPMMAPPTPSPGAPANPS
jgi:hypothetical protein